MILLMFLAGDARNKLKPAGVTLFLLFVFAVWEAGTHMLEAVLLGSKLGAEMCLLAPSWLFPRPVDSQPGYHSYRLRNGGCYMPSLVLVSFRVISGLRLRVEVGV